MQLSGAQVTLTHGLCVCVCTCVCVCVCVSAKSDGQAGLSQRGRLELAPHHPPHAYRQ